MGWRWVWLVFCCWRCLLRFGNRMTEDRFEEILVAADPKPKRASGSPTQRSKAYLENAGYLVAITERWNPHAKVRQDMFGFIDMLAVKEGEILGVQTTSRSNM